jgi:hypothetical protein
MIRKIVKIISDRLYLLLISDGEIIKCIIKQCFPNAIELEYDDFKRLNTPPLCYNKKERQQELNRIIKKSLSLK